MLTWRLWRGLNTSPEAQFLFHHVGASDAQAVSQYFSCLELIGLVLFVPIIVFPSAVYGMGWAIEISSTISREHQRDTFDVFSTFPSGALGACWELCIVRLRHGNRSLSKMISSENWKARLAIISILTLIAARDLRENDLPLTPVLSYSLASLLFLFVDHFQSVVLSVIIGMVTPTFSRNRFDAPLYALGTYLTVQFISYAIPLLLHFGLLPAIFEATNINDSYVSVLLPLVSFAGFYVFREVTIILLWRTLLYRLNADSAELDFLLARHPH